MTEHHDHNHFQSDPFLLSNKKGIKALKISFLGLMVTAVFQAVIFMASGSAALLADTFHNFIDAFTAFPLWIAFLLARRKPNTKFTYGYNRIEDLVGLLIVVIIFGTAIIVGYDSITKIRSGFVPKHLEWVVVGAIIGFIGNEWVARYRIKIGKEINSAALIADGQHARADALTSLGVLVGTIGVYLGYPMADPIVGVVIAMAIVHIGWISGKSIFVRLMDAISPETVHEIHGTASSIPGVLDVMDIRARCVGQQMRVDLTITVDKNIRVLDGHEIAIDVQHTLQSKFPNMVSPNIHVDPEGHQGEEHHFVAHHRKEKSES